MDYIYIRAYGAFAELDNQFIRDEVQKAHDDKAPGNVIFKRDDGLWATIDDLGVTGRQQVQQIAGRIRRDNPPETRTII